MNRRRPLLIVSLPARNTLEARRQVEQARAAGADIAELRLDRWDSKAWGDLPSLFPSPLPLLATLRSKAEGGQGPDGPEERLRILTEVRRYPFAFIDLEPARDAATVHRPPPRDTVVPPPHEVWSTHFPSGSDAATLAREIRRPPAGAAFIKVVVPASLAELWTTVFPQLPPPGEGRFVLHTTGASGPILRALSADLGMAAVYCSLPDRASGPADEAAPVDTAQIPVDRLARHFVEGDSPGPRFAVVGHPVAHSLSPSLHSSWMAAAGLHGLYVALDVGTEKEFAESLDPLAANGFRGLNVTHPWKEAALRLSTSASRAAERCGCANMLTFREGEIEAENTDMAGVIRRLGELKAEGRWDGESLTVLGAGGAARATLAAAQELGAKAFVVGRDSSKAGALADAFGAAELLPGDPVPAQLLVHATTAGRRDSAPLGFAVERWMSPGGHVLDFVYGPEDPFLSDLARAKGATYEDGERLLRYQAAVTFELWWHLSPLSSDPGETPGQGGE